MYSKIDRLNPQLTKQQKLIFRRLLIQARIYMELQTLRNKKQRPVSLVEAILSLQAKRLKVRR